MSSGKARRVQKRRDTLWYLACMSMRREKYLTIPEIAKSIYCHDEVVVPRRNQQIKDFPHTDAWGNCAGNAYVECVREIREIRGPEASRMAKMVNEQEGLEGFDGLGGYFYRSLEALYVPPGERLPDYRVLLEPEPDVQEVNDDHNFRQDREEPEVEEVHDDHNFQEDRLD